MRGKVALITGASNGIGRAAALALARQGATLALAGRDERRLEATLASARAAGDEVEAQGLLADLATQSGARQLAEDFRQRYTRLDVL